MPGGRLQPQLLSAKVLKGRKQSRAASEIQGEEKCLPLQGPDQKKVLETPQQRPFPGRSCGPLLLSASLLLLTLLSSLLTLLALSPREEGMKGWCLEINISKSISEGCCLELPDQHVREPQHRVGPGRIWRVWPPAAFVPALSSLIFLLRHIKEKHHGQTWPARLSQRSNRAPSALLRKR